MPSAPPNLPVPKGWKPPPGVSKPSRAYIPPSPKVYAPSKPAPRMFTGLQPPTHTFQQAIQRAKQRAQPSRQQQVNEASSKRQAQNKLKAELGREALRTGKLNPNLVRYANDKPNVAEARPGRAPKPGLLDRIMGGISKGEKFVEHGIASGLGATGVTPGFIGGQTHPLSGSEKREAQQRASRVITQVGEVGLSGGAASALRAGAKGLEVAKAAKGAEAALADREALRAAAGGAVRGVREGVPKEVLAKAPTTAKQLGDLQKAVEATGGAPTGVSRALRVGGGAAAGYGKLLAVATPAKAAVGAASEPPKKHEPFVEKFWHDAIHTVANLPAAAVEGVVHPVKTAQGMLEVYKHPKKAFDENSFGTLLAFLAPGAALERGAGAAVRGVSKDRLLSQTRADLQYQSGERQARQYQPGAVTQLAQRAGELPGKIATREKLPGLRKVSGERFVQALGQARKGSKLHAENLHQHEPSDYTHAYLTKDGKAGYAVIKTGKKLPDGRPEVELVNLFHNGAKGQGTGSALVRHAVSQHGANTLDAFEGKLTRKYAAHGFETVRREANYTKGGPDVLYMRRPNVDQATKFQERRDILGSRAGGVVRPGQVDLIRGGERLARNLEVMKAHHFLDQHLPHDPVHATALMTLLQGEAKTAGSFWPDVADRVATLKDQQHKLTGTDLAHNKEQIQRLVEMEQSRSKISDADLAHYEKAAGQIATAQREKWTELNQEGIGHPQQLNARNLPALLSHGHLMGRGDLQFLSEPGPHGLVGLVKEAKAARDKASKEVRTLRLELKGRAVPKGVKQGQHFKLEEATARYHHYNDLLNERHQALTVAKHSGAILPNGNRFPGVYDAAGQRITPAEAEAFLNEHFGGREMGFVTQKQDLARARSQNTYGPRTIYPMRTGGNFTAGAYDNSPAALRNHFERAARNLAAMRGRRSVAENLVRMDKDGKPMTEQNAKLAADNMNRTAEGEATKPHLGEWVPYNLGAEKTAQLITGHPYTKELEQQGLIEHKALLEEGKGTPTWGILPKQVADRLNKWDSVESQVQGSMLRKMTTPWRQTNLYTSVRWPFGTTQENAIRLAAHQVSPLVVLPFGKHTSISFGTGSHIVKFLDEKITDPSVPHAQKQLATFHRSQFGTGNFVGSQLHELDPALHEFAQGSIAKRISETAPNTKIWRPYRRFVGNSLNRMETNAKVAAGGKLARQDQPFFDKFRKVSSEQAAHDYVEKLTTDPAQSIKAAQNLMEIMGNWNHLTPYTRQAQAEWAPFALWWLNSAKFVFKTLPRDHPYATGLLAAMVTGTGAANRNLKPYLEGTVPLKLPILGEINLNPVHYSPFDIAGEPLEKAASMIAPQITEPIMTAKGVDPLTGEKFTGDKANEGNEGTSGGRVAMSTLESYVPGIRLASQLSREGGIPTKTTILPWEATRKLGLGKAALKSFSPFMFTYKRQKATKGSGGTVGPPGLSGGYGSNSGGYGEGSRGGYGSNQGGYGK